MSRYAPDDREPASIVDVVAYLEGRGERRYADAVRDLEKRLGLVSRMSDGYRANMYEALERLKKHEPPVRYEPPVNNWTGD